MRVLHYDLDVAILPEYVPAVHVLWGGSIRVRARVDLDLGPAMAGATGDDPAVFAIYRLLQVARITAGSPDTAGAQVDIPFATSVEILPDMPTYQVRLVSINGAALRRVAAADRRVSVWLDYGGPVCGAREAMTYVHDHVSEAYTLLREEVYWYPALYRGGMGPTWRGKEADGPAYELRVTCPAGQTAVSGGTLVAVESVPAPTGAKVTPGGWVRYHWRADIESFMGISCAAYQKHASDDGRVSLYCFPEDAAAADVAMTVVRRTMALCGRWLGPTQSSGITVAEIPPGWGSQSSRLLILQTADGLSAAATGEGAKRLYSELGHEVAHLWSVPSLEPENTRWLDEGMTHFMEALLLAEAFGPGAYAERMASYRRSFIRDYAEIAAVPLAACGPHLFRDSIARGKGPWALAILRELFGDDLLAEVMRRFTQTYLATGATPADFCAMAGAVTGRDLTRFITDWFATTISSELLASELTATELADRYR